jgi:hypothetical protein
MSALLSWTSTEAGVYYDGDEEQLKESVTGVDACEHQRHAFVDPGATYAVRRFRRRSSPLAR